MGLTVRTNMQGISSSNSLNKASRSQQKSMKKLASGFKINSAGDDASGLAISEKMKNLITALDTDINNCEDGVSLIQTTEGYETEVQNMIGRMTELAEKSANGVLDDEDRSALQDEMNQICGEIDRIASTACFNNIKLFTGEFGGNGSVKLFADPMTEKIGYFSPSANGYNGGVADTSNLPSGNFEITAYSQPTLTVKDRDGNTSSVTLSAQDGDKIFLKKGETTGTTALGVELTTAADTTKDRTLTYNSSLDAWVDQNDTASTATLDFKVVLPSTLRVSDSLALKISETSTKADVLEMRINSLHTDTIFGGLDGFVNKTLDESHTEATAALKVIHPNSESTYKNSYSINITERESAAAAADALQHVSSYISDERGRLGAYENRLNHTVIYLSNASENTTAANSRIRDTDMAKEMMSYTSKNVITQAAQSMLAQANSQPQNVLSLIQQ